VSAERILLAASTSEAYGWLFKLLANPADEVLVPRPSYPLFDFLASLESVRAVQYPLYYDGRWGLDIHALEAAITDRTRAIALVNPNNPTGAFLKRGELEQLVSLCARRGLAMISDEVFAGYPLCEDAERIPTLTGVDQVLTFCLSGLSKVAGLPQLKLGWVTVNGPEPLLSEALARLELIADTYLSVGTPVQLALPALLSAAETIQKQIRTRTRHNLDQLRNAAAARFSRAAAACGGRMAGDAGGAEDPHRGGVDRGAGEPLRRAGAAGILLRFRLRGFSDFEPAHPAGRV
jgi:Aspartate/tyrosine/aromatic aminotransferase